MLRVLPACSHHPRAAEGSVPIVTHMVQDGRSRKGYARYQLAV